MPRLIVKSAGSSRTVELGDEAVTLGRTPDNTIPVDDAGASRKHAQILFIGRGYEVVDLGSRNGTKVNGARVARAILKPGDVIAIGAVEILFDDGAGGGADGGGLEIEELDLGGGPAAPVAAARGAPAAGGPAGQCVLRFVDGERRGQEVPLGAGRTTFGRRNTNTFAFQDASVSGVHCEITREPGGYVLRDLGSTNGTVVDGEPVVECLLRHNSRIRIGAQRILFVDTGVADMESSLAAADDGDGWGMMRGELDVAAASRRGGGGAVVAGSVVIVAVAAGAFLLLDRDSRGPAVAEVPGNLVDDASFEEGVVRWFSVEEEGGATARIEGSAQKPLARSGASCLAVAGSGPARVGLGGDPIPVTADTLYEASVAVGSGRGSLVVTWISSTRPGLVRVAASPPVEGGGAWPVSTAVVAVPAQATAARLELVGWDGSATFDDVVFRRVDGAPPTFEGPGDLKVRLLAGGRMEAVRAGEVLFTDGGIAPAVDAPETATLGAVLDGAPAAGAGGIEAKGRLPGGAGFRVQVGPAPGGARLLCVPTGQDGAFTLTIPGAAMRGGVTLVHETSAAALGDQERGDFPGVRKVIVDPGEPGRPFLLSATAAGGLDVATLRTDRGLRMRIAPAAGAGADGAAVDLAVDLSLEEEGGRRLLGEAEQFRARGELGRAASAYARVAAEFHYLAPLRERATKAIRELDQDGDGRLRELRRLLKSATRFGSIPGLEDVAHRARRLAAEFDGHGRAEEANGVAAQATEELARARLASVEGRVESLYREATAREEAGEAGLARALFEEIARIAPADSEFLAPSREKAKALAARAAAASERQFKAR